MNLGRNYAPPLPGLRTATLEMILGQVALVALLGANLPVGFGGSR